MDVWQRLQALVDRDFGESINAAARKWGVPYATLHRYLKGYKRPSGRPRGGAHLELQGVSAKWLALIAKFYRTTVEWLLEGRGPDPLASQEPFIERLDWEDVLGRLDLPDDVYRVFRGLPYATATADAHVCLWGLHQFPGTAMDAVERRAALQGRWRAQARELESWSSLVAGWIESFGTPAVREKLISEVGRARFGFQPFALHLLNRGLLAPIDLASAYADLRPLEDMPSVVRGPLMIGKPELPPLGIKQGSVKKRRGKKP